MKAMPAHRLHWLTKLDVQRRVTQNLKADATLFVLVVVSCLHSGAAARDTRDATARDVPACHFFRVCCTTITMLLLTLEHAASPRNKLREDGRQRLLSAMTAVTLQVGGSPLLPLISSHPSQKAGELTLDLRLPHRLAANVPSDWWRSATIRRSRTQERLKGPCYASQVWHGPCTGFRPGF
jgi:hypothetical protein